MAFFIMDECNNCGVCEFECTIFSKSYLLIKTLILK